MNSCNRKRDTRVKQLHETQLGEELKSGFYPCSPTMFGPRSLSKFMGTRPLGRSARGGWAFLWCVIALWKRSHKPPAETCMAAAPSIGD
ncbi:hypothetical protein BV22DRAFT_1120279 [Leucogyrophana mollusca]|uniref:Uncharacterized protein n=1 Tax=Leucogyrophana mollusca TaxID=85980 RepID=A0ACB8BEJ8_9AGAM|nr:hypothetical protein BV22DRAFT_1120279 [Leucogyrophana mollusca]